MKAIQVFACGAALIASPALAATYATSTGGPDASIPAGLLTIDFNSANVLGDIAGLSGNAHIVQGTTGSYAQPLGGTTKYLSIPANGSSGAALLDLSGYDFGGIVDGFSFFWGSIDTYNSVKINTSAGTMSFAYDGIGMNPPPADGSQGNAANNRRVYFSLAPGETLNSIEFISTGVAFELDDLVFTGQATAVPEPASWAMMIAGFGLVGGALRRRDVRLAIA